MSENVLLQNLRDCTVQIRHGQTDKIVGTGIAVSMDGKIVTCVHVAGDALGVHPRHAYAEGAEVGVYFPQAHGGETKARRATVAACFPQHDDDVVLLQLTGGPAPLAPEQIAVLGTAEPSEGNPFRSYGYRNLAPFVGGIAEGKILGPVEPPQGQNWQVEPVQLKSSEIAPGMSGSAVLDTQRNLVVGLVALAWFPDQSTKDRDTAWAVNARVVGFDPLCLSLQDVALPMRPAPQPRADADQVRTAIGPKKRSAWNNAPPPLKEWVGRADLFRSITADWADPNCHVTGLIGFGGEGKSSLARKWVDDLLSPLPKSGEGPGERAQPDGVFWWGFYERPSVDEFFEAALKYMSGDRIDPRTLPSANAKAHFIAAMLYTGRYLFILDGLEVMQHQDGNPYGLLKSSDLREFLSYFAAPGHPSFCLVTSRAPLLDLMEYTTYTHRDVDRLSAADGCDLLRKVGVRGADAQLDAVVADWDGHALTLSLLGGLLAERHGGDVTHLADLPAPVAGEPRYERVHRVLRRYDEHLTEAECTFLKLFSAFRAPVHESAFDKVFRPLLPSPQPSPQQGEGDAPFSLVGTLRGAEDEGQSLTALVNRLVTYRILRHDPKAREYTAHPLIRAHYFTLLTQGDRAATQAAHERIKDYYLSIAGDTPQYPTLDDLRPLIEVVHHACRAGAYSEAHRIRRERIDQFNRFVLMHELGACETYLTLVMEFFPDGNVSQEPQGNESEKRWILNTVGLCLMNLGRLGEAVPFYERKNALYEKTSTGYLNLAELHAYLGALTASADAAREALALARRAENKQAERNSLAYQAWADHLRGELAAAGAAFAQAAALEGETDPNARYLSRNGGVWHADHMWRMGDTTYSRHITTANLEICERNHWTFIVSRCHRVLGDLDTDAGQHESAREQYNEALKIARGISFRPALIEALLARGRFAARQAALAKVAEPSQGSGSAFDDLNEALGYALAGGHRMYEADIRIGLAWAHLALSPGPSPTGRGELEAARAEAEHARAMSEDMGYHWGKVDAEQVLSAIVG